MGTGGTSTSGDDRDRRERAVSQRKKTECNTPGGALRKEAPPEQPGVPSKCWRHRNNQIQALKCHKATELRGIKKERGGSVLLDNGNIMGPPAGCNRKSHTHGKRARKCGGGLLSPHLVPQGAPRVSDTTADLEYKKPGEGWWWTE